MLVHVHKPVVAEIKTIDGEPSAFHIVELTDYAAAGKIDLFISADWSEWNALVAKVDEYRQAAAVRALGGDNGRNAGGWVVDGNTSGESAQRLIDGYRDGDPAVLDIMPSPLDTDGVDTSEADIYRAAAGVMAE